MSAVCCASGRGVQRAVFRANAASLRRPATFATRRRSLAAVTKAMLEPEGDKKKFLTREEEPEQYWSSAGEKEGANPMKDPLAIIGVVAILFPFLFVLVAIGTGAIDTSVYR